MEHASHFSTKEVAEGESEVQGHPQFHSAVDTASNNHLSLELLFTNFNKKKALYSMIAVSLHIIYGFLKEHWTTLLH